MFKRRGQNYVSIAVVTLLLLLVTAAVAEHSVPVQSAVDRLAKVLKIEPEEITVVSAEVVTWRDTSLGVPREGRAYLQVLTSGYRVILEAEGTRYEYHTDMGRRVVLASKSDSPKPPPPPAEKTSDILDKCRADLAKRLGILVDDVEVVREAPHTFADTSLGLAKPGEVYLMMINPGRVVILKAGPWLYLYTCTEGTFRYGGPVGAWHWSTLYIEPVANEPNFNGNLTQVTLVGTNPQTVLEGVTDFRPQRTGSIIAKRRTSRSGHELYYVAPGKFGEAIKLGAAFDFGDAAVNEDDSEYVVFSRRMVGAQWQVTRGTLAEDGDSVEIDLPEDARPSRLYWHRKNPSAVVTEGEKTVYYELVEEDGELYWQIDKGFFPPEEEYMLLNKSETLMIDMKMVDDKPVTRVSREWFTGAETKIATLEGFELLEYFVSPDKAFALLRGMVDEKVSVVVVDLGTGEVLHPVAKPRGRVQIFSVPPKALSTFLPYFKAAMEQ